MKILPTTIKDINVIFELYEEATAFQKTVNNKSWNGFERALIENEISENRHFKIVEDDKIACSFVITFNDPVIWEDALNDKAIYLHRIATSPNFRGRSYVKKIVAWAIEYGKENNLSFIRLDTHSGNDRIKNHYINCGFTYKGNSTIKWTTDLPEHYKEGPLSLFEIVL